MNKFKTAVLIHGCHLQADLNGKAWEKIIWGAKSGDESPTLSGRAVMGLYTALTNNADFVIFSTGASDRQGIKEGEFTKNFLQRHTAQLSNFFQELGLSDATEESLKDFLEHKSVLDLISQNTVEECELNLKYCADRQVEQLIIVSSHWHLPRCMLNMSVATKKLETEGIKVPRVYGVYADNTGETVVILEPPHRGDRPKTIWHHLAPRFFKIHEDRREAFEEDLQALFARYGA